MLAVFLSRARHLPHNGAIEKIPVTTRRFPDGELYLRLDNPEKIRGKKVVVFQSLYPGQNDCLVELFLAIDTINRYSPSRVIVCVPYFAYARQDKEFVLGEALSFQAIVRTLSRLGVSRIVSVDVHALRGVNRKETEGVEFLNLSAAPLLVERAREKHPGLVVTSPDLGGSKWLDSLGIEYEKGFTKKKVCPSCGMPAQECTCGTPEKEYRVVVEYKGGDLSGRTVLVLDDMIAGGGTMAGAVKALRDLGAGRVVCAATHGLFVGSAREKLEGLADGIIVTNTIDPERVDKPEGTMVVDVAPLLSRALEE